MNVTQTGCQGAEALSAGSRTEKALRAGVLLGGAGFVAGLLWAPDRIWPAFLIAVTYLVHLGLAAAFFLAVQNTTKAGWSVLLRRVPEAMTASLAWAALLVPMLLFGVHELYSWTHEDAFTGAHAWMAGKKAWLNLPFFSVRTFLYFAAWLLPAALLVRNSRLQDDDGLIIHTVRNRKVSAIFLFLFAITVSAASFDWLMSLEPEWYSTIFGAYVFAGLFLTGSAATTIVVILLRRKGSFRKSKFCRFDHLGEIAPEESLISPAHLHDLGKLVFAFSSFWAYLWFCQFMLIWYTNMPEESLYFARRMRGGWETFFWINVALNWVIPFFGLMSRTFKRDERILLLVSLSVLLGHWVDLYVMVQPVFFDRPVLGLWELAPMCGVAALFLLTTFVRLRAVPLIPLRDPLVEESVLHRM